MVELLQCCWTSLATVVLLDVLGYCSAVGRLWLLD